MKSLKEILGDNFTPEIEKAIETEKKMHAETAIKGYKEIHLPKVDKLQSEVDRLSPLETQVKEYKTKELINSKKATLIKDYGIKDNLVDKFMKLNELPDDIESEDFKKATKEALEDDFNKSTFLAPQSDGGGVVMTDNPTVEPTEPKIKLTDAEKRLIG